MRLPVILGNEWINGYEAALCHGPVAKLKFSVGGKRYSIYNPEECNLKEGGRDKDSQDLISASHQSPVISSMIAE